ncbi:MAG TPA: DNA-processing protein DprA [Methylomirabilota bacterium]|nr:DNA-processing protein DprA [Methylomirabilota bacterium]
MDDRSYWVGFSVFPGIGPGRFAKLLSHFGTAKDAWNASEKELASIIGKALTESFAVFRKNFSLAAYESQLQSAKVSYLIKDESDYPTLLKQIKNPPFVLYCKGNKEILKQVQNDIYIGIVGTRKITSYGKQVTEMITAQLVDAGCVIVSGLALGVDAVSHTKTLESGGKTIAVLGCGVDYCYPRENEKIYAEILEKNGAVVSEYALGAKPTIGSFPSRNRIIAGLSLGIVVTEGSADSGALITAKDALANNRKVFAVPGPVTSSLSQGPYQLIKKGATVVSSAKEILDELGIRNKELGRSKKLIKGDTKEEQQIIVLLQQENIHIDELIKRTQIDSAKIGGILSLMEMKGMIQSLDAGFFCLQRD